MHRLIFAMLIMMTLSAWARDVHTENAWLEWAGHGVYPDDLTFVDFGTDRERLVISNRVTSADAVGLDTNNAAFVAWYAARRAAQANAASIPATFRHGVAVPIPDADGHYMLIQPQGDGLPIVGIQISDSPIDPAAWRARRDATLARLEAERAAKAAAYETRKAAAQQAAQGAQNVPQLRAAMADMQAQIDALRAIVEAGR